MLDTSDQPLTSCPLAEAHLKEFRWKCQFPALLGQRLGLPLCLA